MEIVPFVPENRSEWNKFCASSADAWFWHTAEWIDYCVEYGKKRYNTKNISFLIRDDSGIVGICPLLSEEIKDMFGVPRIEFSAAGMGGAGIAPALRDDLAEDRRGKVLNKIFENIDLLADKYKAARSAIRMTSLASKNIGFNWLLKYGYFDISLNTQIIDLNPDVDVLRSAVRKGHKYDIGRGKKCYEIRIYDAANIDKETFDQYRILHHKASGRVTRPVETFDMMYNWIRSGSGLLCEAKVDGKFAGFVYVILYKESGYYASASDDPDIKINIPASHTIQWSIIEWLKAHGCKSYEVGTQQFGPVIHDLPTAKDMGISLFKRGFGGRTMPLFRGEKFYDVSFMKNVMADRFDSFTAALVDKKRKI